MDHLHSFFFTTAYSGYDRRSLSAYIFPPSFPCDPGQNLTISTFVFVFNLCFNNGRLHYRLFLHPQNGGFESHYCRCRRSKLKLLFSSFIVIADNWMAFRAAYL